MTKHGNKTVVVCDSLIKQMKWKLFKKSFENTKCFVNSNSGTKTRDLMYYAIPTPQKQKPIIKLTMTGDNDVNYNKKII